MSLMTNTLCVQIKQKRSILIYKTCNKYYTRMMDMIFMSKTMTLRSIYQYSMILYLSTTESNRTQVTSYYKRNITE